LKPQAGAGTALVINRLRVRAVDRHPEAQVRIQGRRAAPDGQPPPADRASARSFRHPDATPGRCRSDTPTTGPGSSARSAPLVPGRQASGLTGDWTASCSSGREACGGPPGCTPRSAARQSGPEFLEVAPACGSAAHWVGRQLHGRHGSRTPAMLRGCELAGGQLAIDVDVGSADLAATADSSLSRWVRRICRGPRAGSLRTSRAEGLAPRARVPRSAVIPRRG